MGSRPLPIPIESGQVESGRLCKERGRGGLGGTTQLWMAGDAIAGFTRSDDISPGGAGGYGDGWGDCLATSIVCADEETATTGRGFMDEANDAPVGSIPRRSRGLWKWG